MCLSFDTAPFKWKFFSLRLFQNDFLPIQLITDSQRTKYSFQCFMQIFRQDGSVIVQFIIFFTPYHFHIKYMLNIRYYIDQRIIFITEHFGQFFFS